MENHSCPDFHSLQYKLCKSIGLDRSHDSTSHHPPEGSASGHHKADPEVCTAGHLDIDKTLDKCSYLYMKTIVRLFMGLQYVSDKL